MQARFPDVPALLISGYAPTTALPDTSKVDLLLKTFSGQELLQRVAAARRRPSYGSPR